MILRNILFACLIISIVSCKSSTSESSGEAQEEKVVTEGVCVYNYSKYGLPLYSDMASLKKSVASIKLGEKVKTLGESAIDSVKNKNYIKVELSDGTIGWCREAYIISDAKPAAIIAATPVYDRPDILTKSTSKKYDEINFTAVTETKDDWIKVAGINSTNKGWIKKESVSFSEEDIAMAILARKEIFNEKGNLIEDKLGEFLVNAPFKNSVIVEKLRTHLEEKEAKSGEEIPENILDEPVADTVQ